MQNLTVGILGLGLIGGSFARAIKKNLKCRVFGYDVSPETMQAATREGVIDGKLFENLESCDYILLALFPHAICEFLETFSPKIRKNAVVIDCGGIKEEICRSAFPLAQKYDYTFIGGHPMAGKEYSGFSHADAALFEGASMILVPPYDVSASLFASVSDFFCKIGFARITNTTAKIHDAVIACTSQLAHVVSSAYVKSPTASQFSGFSAGSYRDMTRVARLNETMWTELFMANRENLIFEIDGLIERLNLYKNALLHKDDALLYALLQEGRIQKETQDASFKEMETCKP